MQGEHSIESSSTSTELYFLIVKFLAGGPCRDIAQALRCELERRKILPPRLDWLGNQHEQSFQQLESKFQHIGSNHLLDLCRHLGPLLSQDKSSWSLLQPLTDRNQSVVKYSSSYHGLSFSDPPKLQVNHNILKLIQGREHTSKISHSRVLSPKFYSRQQLFCKTLGHLSSVYCVLFDRSGKYVFTGADDLLVKVWSVHTGRLLATLRGASSEITDIDVNPENTLIAAGSCDKIVRVWCLQTTAPVAVLSSHTGMITSVNFCPHSTTSRSSAGHTRYLVSTSTDGSVAFWTYKHRNISTLVTFQPKPTQYHERMRPGQAQMICSAFSPGGAFLAAGSADHHVRVYHMSDDGPTRILEKEAHTDRVDSIQWAASGLRFVSGSKDGTALIWNYEAGNWHYLSLNMYSRLPGTEVTEEEAKLKLKVSMVAWAMNDKWVITAVNDFSLKVWDSFSGSLCHVLSGHKDEVFVLERHPLSPGLVLSAGHDGQIILWDVCAGTQVRSYCNTMEGQGHGAVFDAKWSPDGSMVAATDSHGHLLLFGLGTNEKYKKLPKQLFFHTDYRPLIRDTDNWVLDEQTQLAPHVMPPPFLVDVDGNPYPPNLQRLVPGREACREEQLIPNIIITDDGDQEVIEGIEVQGVEAEQAPDVVQPPVPSTSTASTNAGPSASDASTSNAGPSTSGLSTSSGTAPVPTNPAQAAAAAAILRLQRTQESSPPAVNNAAANNVVVVQPARSNIDQMIEQLARDGPAREVPRPASAQRESPNASRPSPARQRNAAQVAYRRSGDVEGVRQSRGNWQGQNENDQTVKRTLLRMLSGNALQEIQTRNAYVGTCELDHYNIEKVKPPKHLMPQQLPRRPNKRPTNRSQQHNYRTRAAGVEFQDPENSPSSSDNDGDFNGSDRDSSSDNSDSSNDSSDYSDWIADTGANLEPPKRSRRKPVRAVKTRSSQDDDQTQSDDEDQKAGPSSGPSRRDSRLRQAPKKTKRPDESPTPSQSAAKILGNKKELPEVYRPSEWLSEVIPRKAPYYPQMGDEVMYFRQGHQQYLNAVRTKKVYELGPRCEPWLKRKDIRDQEFVKVIGIKYEIRPPRLCCLKLALLNSASSSMTSTFTIKYHDMADVLDFIVLKQSYDSAMERNWKPGDQFRCMIDDSWWIGTIESHEPFDPDFPDSSFQCFQVRWDNGEYERMSPWDLEPIDSERLPAETGGSVPVLPSEIQATLYQSTVEDWPPNGDRDDECQRILSGIEKVMTLSAAEPFTAPVDLNQYPSYAVIVEYPIDLSTIKARLENHFYRRVTSVQYDVRFIATNAEKFNQRNSNIVKQARIVTELCLGIIKGHQAVEVSSMYHEMMDNYKSDSDTSQSDLYEDDESEGGTTKRKLKATRRSVRQINKDTRTSSRPKRMSSSSNIDVNAWKRRCNELLDFLWSSQDSEPFRQPVDPLVFRDYLQMIDTPMDLTTVREELHYGNYESPLDFSKDVQLIISNSKNYNTNKKSRIYGMTVRLSVLFGSRMKSILEDWRKVRRRQALSHSNRNSGNGSPNKKPSNIKSKTIVNRQKTSTSGSSTSRASSSASSQLPIKSQDQPGSSRRPVINSSESEDDNIEGPALAEPPQQPKPSTSAKRFDTKIVIRKTSDPVIATLVNNGHIAPSELRVVRNSGRLATNTGRPRRVQRLATLSDDEEDSGPAQASTAESGASTGAAEPEPTDHESCSSEEEGGSSNHEPASDNSDKEFALDEDDVDSEEEVARPRRKRTRNKSSSDSEDSYAPVNRRSTRKSPVKKNKSLKSNDRTQRKRQKICYQEDDSDEELARPTNTRARRRPAVTSPNSDDSSSSTHHKKSISISSRGRVRKITERARGLFGD